MEQTGIKSDSGGSANFPFFWRNMGNAIYRISLGGFPYQIWETEEYGELISPFLTEQHPFQVLIFDLFSPGLMYVLGGKTIFDEFYPDDGDTSLVLQGTTGGVAYKYIPISKTWQETHIFDFPEEYEEVFQLLDSVGFDEEFHYAKYSNHTSDRGPM